MLRKFWKLPYELDAPLARNESHFDASARIDAVGPTDEMRLVSTAITLSQLGAQQVEGTSCNAGLMSLTTSAQRQENDIRMYLETAIWHLLRGTARPEELLPDRWNANHPEAVRTYREQDCRDKANTATLSAGLART